MIWLGIINGIDNYYIPSSVPRDEMLEHELSIADRRAKREIRQLEEEIPRWQAIVDTLNEAGTAPTEFDSQTLAVLRGRLVRYLMRSREVRYQRHLIVFRKVISLQSVINLFPLDYSRKIYER